MITIKKTTMDDLDDIIKLHLELCKSEQQFDDEYMIEWAYDEAEKNQLISYINNSFCVIARENATNQPVGFLVGNKIERPHFDARWSWARLNLILITEKFRRQGVANDLINTFKKWCKEQGISRMMLTTFSGNIGAIEFYKKHGFNEHLTSLTAKL